MSTSQTKAEQVVREFVARVKPDAGEVQLSTPLFADGVGLDSLESAELSALLEDELGTDPFTADVMPETVGDVVSFYAVPAEA